MIARLCLLLPVTLAVLGCGAKGKSPEVAATVNGTDITMADVQKVARNLQKQPDSVDPAAQGTTPAEKLYYTAVNRLVEQKLLVDGAEKAGLKVTEEEIAKSMEELISMAGGPEKFQELIAEQGISQADVDRDMRNNLLLRAYFDHVRETAPAITEEDLQKYFDAHPEVFGPQPEVHARHILVMADASAPDMQKAEAKQKALEAHQRAKAGESFEKLAAEFSQDPGSAQQGGDLGWFGKGRMVAPFDSASFALEPGQLSGVVQTQFGYHVIKVEEKRTTPAREFAEVKESIRQVMGQEHSQTIWKNALDELKAASKTEIQPPTPAILDSLAA